MDVCGYGPKTFQKSSSRGTTFLYLIESFLCRFTKDEMALMAVLARRIRLRRNTLVFEGIFIPPLTVFSLAAENLRDFQLTHQTNQHSVAEAVPPITMKWQHPPSGVIKVNWDAAVNKKEGCVGIGIIARDWEGKFMGAQCIFCSIAADPLVAEAMAATHAVTFSKEVGYFDVMFEGNALQVVRELQLAPPLSSRIGHFVESIQQELVSFRSSSIVHAPREIKWCCSCSCKTGDFF
jgi:hypothetical protein